MEQIQQHEWLHPDQEMTRCKICECFRRHIGLGFVYRESINNAPFTSKEPACITRYPEQETETTCKT